MDALSFVKNTPQNESHAEGPIAKGIERQTAKLPSDTFLWLAVGAMGVSAALQAAGRRTESNFVGQWAPTLLILGLYNKIVKVMGSDRVSRGGVTSEIAEENQRSRTSGDDETGRLAV